MLYIIKVQWLLQVLHFVQPCANKYSSVKTFHHFMPREIRNIHIVVYWGEAIDQINVGQNNPKLA